MSQILIPFPAIDSTQIFHEFVGRRSLIYLDSRIWIDLAEVKSADARKCLDLCRQARKAGTAIFPLSCASVSELLEQPSDVGDSRYVQADLMDEFSDGIVIRPHHELTDVECDAVAPMFVGEEIESPAKSTIFTFVVNYLGNNSRLREGAISQETASFTNPWYRSVRWLLERFPNDEFRNFHTETKQTLVERVSAAIRTNSNERNAALLDESIAVFMQTIPAIIKAVQRRYGLQALAGIELLIQSQGEGGRKRLEQLLSAMPATFVFTRVMASRRNNSERTVRPQDFWDHEHAIVAPYVDAFATERNLSHILKSDCNVEKMFGTRVLKSIAALNEHLTTLRE